MRAPIFACFAAAALVAAAALAGGLGDDGLFLHGMRTRTDSMHGAPRAVDTFNPLTLTSLRGWYKSDTGITIATGVSQWDDQSGQANHLVQAVAGAQPVVTAAAINGLPAITFDGVDDFMTKAFTLVQPTTVFIVFRQNTWTSTDSVCDGMPTANRTKILQITATPNLSINAGSTTANNSNLALGTFGLATAIFSGASSSLQINSTTATTGNASTNGGGGVTLGAAGGGGSAWADVAIAEYIVMAATATPAEIAGVKSYVAARYGFAP